MTCLWHIERWDIDGASRGMLNKKKDFFKIKEKIEMKF